MLKKMLPILAMLVAGYLAKQGGDQQGGGLGGLASMLDFDGDGNPLDDIIGMAGKLTR